MQYPSYIKMKRKAYNSLNKLMTPQLWEENAKDGAIRDLSVEFLKLSIEQKYALALDTLDRSSCFCGWYQKELITHLTFPILLNFLSQLLDRALLVQEVKFLAEIRGVIKTAYRLLRDSDNADENELPSELENELAKLWEIYSIASESFLIVADKWFEKYVDN